MTAAKLVRPSVEYKESFLSALLEYQQDGQIKYYDSANLRANFEGFVKNLLDERYHPATKFQDWVDPVPETRLWMVKDGEVIGLVSIRNRLNWHLEKWGGHISFSIRPSIRGKGFGKKILLKALPYANYLGVEKALMTIAPNNVAAIRIVESCGGELIDEKPKTDQFPARCRFWLDCS